MRLKTANVGYSIPGFGTALPGSPVDGDLFILTDSVSAPTYQWLLRYVSAKASNKWVCIGGASPTVMVATAEGTSSASYVALTTAGPVFALPVAGDYNVSIGYTHDTASANRGGIMSFDIGGTGAVDGDAVRSSPSNVGAEISAARTMKKSGLTAVTLTAKYKSDTGATNVIFQDRWMLVEPIALGG